jgi:hypothetical protein
VAPRHARLVDAHRGVVSAAEEVLARAKHDLLRPHHHAVLVLDGTARSFALHPRRAAEGVAEPGHGADEARVAGVVAERLAQPVDEDREVHLGHEGLRPEPIVDRRLGHGVRPAVDQQLEQLEGLGGEVHRAPVAQQLTSLSVEDEPFEADARHASPNKITTRSRATVPISPWQSKSKQPTGS